jgi:hypothetical protein
MNTFLRSDRQISMTPGGWGSLLFFCCFPSAISPVCMSLNFAKHPTMPIFLCRWPNGDVSIVSAPNKDDAIEALDEFDNADHADISQLRE